MPGQTFQRMMDEIPRDLDYLFIYMHDVLVTSRSLEEHTSIFASSFVGSLPMTWW